MVGLLALIFGAGSAAAFQEPSLGEIAKREKKRRKAVAATGVPTRTITDANLGSSPGAVPAGEAGTAEAAPTASPGASPEKPDDQLRAEKRAELQQKVDEQKARMDKVRTLMADAQAELNDAANQTVGGRRGALMKLLDDGRAELAACEQRIAEVEEEARRAGVSVSR